MEDNAQFISIDEIVNTLIKQYLEANFAACSKCGQVTYVMDIATHKQWHKDSLGEEWTLDE